jgi:hypothetical protein
MRLECGERRTVHLAFTLPLRAQASHRGAFCRSWTHLSAAVRAGGVGPSAVTLPLRVWPLSAAEGGGRAASGVSLSTVAECGGGEGSDEDEPLDVQTWEESAPPPPYERGLFGDRPSRLSDPNELIVVSDALSPLFGTPAPPGTGAGGGMMSPRLGTPRSPAAAAAMGAVFRRQTSLAPSPLALAEEEAAGGTTSPARIPEAHPARSPDANGGGGGGGGGGGRMTSYAVSCGEQPLLRVALRSPGPRVRAGDCLEGTLHFETPGTALPAATAGDSFPPRRLAVSSVSILLQSEEWVSPGRAAVRRPAAGGSAGGGVGSAGDGTGPCRRMVHEEAWEATADLVRSYFCFSLPRDATPSYAAAAVSLAWRLQFEFTLEHARPAERRGAAPAAVAAAAAALPAEGVQVLRWTLPITLLPPDPDAVGPD